MSKKDKKVITVDPKIYELMKKAGVSFLNMKNIKIKDKKEKKDVE